MHDRINHGTKQSAVIFACIFSDNVLSTAKSVIHFVRSVQLVARMNQPRYAIHDFPVACIKMHAMIHDFMQQVARYDVLIVSPKHIR